MAKKKAALGDDPLKKDDEILREFYKPQKNSKQASKTSVTNKSEKQGYVRCTYYLTPDIVEGVRVYSFQNRIDKSEVVRLALKSLLKIK